MASRPNSISLLNVDYKLAARTIAARLLKVIHLVVAKDQTCGVPGRDIGENVAFLRDVVSFADTFDSPVAILSLDQEKAFDRVDWGFMYATLRKMGFGSSFLKWVSLFYTDVQSAVNVNGYLSPFFSLSRGVHQGCPLSPLLYVLVSEVLACNIRANPRIEGLCLPDSSDPLSPISQYADDTSLVVCSDDAIQACFEVYSIYERGSGSKLNMSKSKGLGRVVLIRLFLWIGRRPRLRSLVFSLGLETLTRITGDLVLLRSPTLSPLGVNASCLFKAVRWSSMLWPCRGCGMWLLLSTCPPGFMVN